MFESLLMDLTGAGCVLRPFPPVRDSAAVAAFAAEPDAELLALCREFHHQNHKAHVLPGDQASEPAYRRAMDARWAASDELQDMRPRTVRGRMAKAGVAARLMEENHGAEPVDAADVFALATLRHLSGRTSKVTSLSEASRTRERLIPRAIELPATTQAGALAKARVVLGLFGNSSGRRSAAVRSLVADLGNVLDADG